MKKLKFDKSLFKITDKFGSLNLFSLAIPQFMELFFINSLALISTIVINTISDQSAVGVGSANKVLGVAILIAHMANTGSAIMLNICMGRNEKENVQKIIYINFITTFVLNMVLSWTVFIFAEPILSGLMHLTGDEYSSALIYLRIRMPFLFLNSLSSNLTTILRCFGFSKPTMVVGIIANIVSTAISVFAVSKLSFFSSSIVGVSVAPVVAAFVSVIIGAIYFIKKGIKIIPKYDFRLLKQTLKVGIPGALSSISYSLSQLLTTSFIITFSAIDKNANIYVSSFTFITYELGYAIGQANAIMVGRRCGAGDVEKADKMHRQNMIIASASNMIMNTVLFASQSLIFRLYTSDQQVLDLIRTILLIEYLVEFGRSLNHLGEFGLNAVGDVYATTTISVSCCWLISVLIAYILGIVCGFGLVGVWFAFGIDETLRGTLYFLRWRSGRWKKKFLNNNQTLQEQKIAI